VLAKQEREGRRKKEKVCLGLHFRPLTAEATQMNKRVTVRENGRRRKENQEPRRRKTKGEGEGGGGG